MSYINGAYESVSANVQMLESEKFGHNLLHIVASADISEGEELLLDYGDMFKLPLPSSNNPSGGVTKKARIKTSGRSLAPDIPEAPPLPRFKTMRNEVVRVKKTSKRKRNSGEAEIKKRKKKE